MSLRPVRPGLLFFLAAAVPDLSRTQEAVYLQLDQLIGLDLLVAPLPRSTEVPVRVLFFFGFRFNKF